MRVTERRPHAHASANEDEGKVRAKKKSENKEMDTKTKKQKVTTTNEDTKNGDGHSNGKSASEVPAEFEDICKITREQLSIDEMRRILEANGQDASGPDDAMVPQCHDILFSGPLERCPVCGGNLQYTGKDYTCQNTYNEWSTCTYSTREPPRKEEPPKVPQEITNPVLVKNHEPNHRPKSELSKIDKPFAGMVISFLGRLSRTHQYWKREIEKHGGKVSNTVHGVTCLVVSPAEREHGGSTKVAEAMRLMDSIVKQELLPMEAYDALTDLALEGRGIPWINQDTSEEALESLSTEASFSFSSREMSPILVKLYGKRSVHKDSKLRDEGGYIFENMAEERVEKKDDVNKAAKEFSQLFEELTGNPFEPWEREKKFEKKKFKFYPFDMDNGIDVRHGGLGLRQLGVAAAHCKLEPLVANFMKVLCGQEIYKWVHYLGTSTFNPAVFMAAAVLETVQDINVASRLVGDMTGPTVDDPVFGFYMRLHCSISALDKKSDDYKMIINYLQKTYEPVKITDVSYRVSVENVFTVEPTASPSQEEIKQLPNKVLLWCEAARYGFTAVDRPEGFLILALVSQGNDIKEHKDIKKLEEEKAGVKGLGRKKTDTSEHFTWNDDIKVPCGQLVPSEHQDSPLEYNQYAGYDPKQTSIRFIVAVKYEEQKMKMGSAE
ncbi:Poly [ADP-ribose] polymerase 3 [Asimina triloba]